MLDDRASGNLRVRSDFSFHHALAEKLLMLLRPPKFPDHVLDLLIIPSPGNIINRQT